MRERALSVDPTTVFHWVQRYAPEINKRIRPHLKTSGTSYRIDETYIKVGKLASIYTGLWTKKVILLNSYSQQNATFPQPNDSSKR
jgi:hypothetical protein